MTPITFEEAKRHICSYGTAVHCEMFRNYRAIYSNDKIRAKFHAFFRYERGCVIMEEEYNQDGRRNFFYRIHQCSPDAEIDAVTEDWRTLCLKNAAEYEDPVCRIIQFYISNGELTEEKNQYHGFRNYARMGYAARKDPRVRELNEADMGVIQAVCEPYLENDIGFGRIEAGKFAELEYDWMKEQDPYFRLYGIFDSGSLCGMATTIYDEDLDLAWLEEIFILPAHRGKGCGKALVETALADYPAKKWHYQVDRDNERSVALAKSLGFTLEGAGLCIL